MFLGHHELHIFVCGMHTRTLPHIYLKAISFAYFSYRLINKFKFPFQYSISNKKTICHNFLFKMTKHKAICSAALFGERKQL